MAFYFITGKLGNGKSLCSVGRIRDKLRAGCPVATNIDLDLVAMFGATAKNLNVIRVPDKPTVEDLERIGNGNPTYDEEKNGLLVLDECGTWFNSRNWQDKSRQAVNNWMLHARKLGWDVLLIVQDISIVDSQARDALSEMTAFCKRLDRVAIPVVGTFFKMFTGGRLKLPRIHMARVVYGASPNDLLSDRWTYRGNDLFACYNTKQAFIADYPHATYSMLTPWHIKGRYQRPRDQEFYMRMTKIYWKRFSSPLALAVGLLAGVVLTASMAFASILKEEKPSPVAQVEQVTPVQNVEPEKVSVAEFVDPPLPDPMVQKIKAFRIVSAVESLKNPNKRYYQFADTPRGQPTGALTSSEDLKAAGLGVLWKSDCNAILIYDGEEYPVYCL